MRNELEETQAGIKIAGRNINNLRYADDTILMAESEEVGRNSVYEFAKLTDFERIIIDDRHPCPDDMIQLLENSKTELTVVSCEG